MDRKELLGLHEFGDRPLNCPDLQIPGISYYSQIAQFPDHLRHYQNDPYFANGLSSPNDFRPDNYLLNNPSFTPAQMDFPGFEIPSYHLPNSDSYYGYTSTNTTSCQDQICSRGVVEDQSGCPRSWQPTSVDPQLFRGFSMEEVASDYGLNQSCADEMIIKEEEDLFNHPIDPFARLSISRSPKVEIRPLSLPETSSSRVSQSDDGEENLLDGAISTVGDPIADEPYAKLIYRALLSAPRHSLVLQEIYQWFIENTDKGQSSGSGWRNSIRHNLSMNAAFRKTERVSDEDSGKKTSEWVLEPFAIKNGVTPTTRYRKFVKKSPKSENPTASRVNAGRKGGILAGKIKSQKLKSELDRQDSARSSPIENRRNRYHARHRMTPSRDQKQICPPTPLGTSLTSAPYYFKGSSYHDVSADVDYNYKLEDVSGVYQDDGPIFCNDGLPRFTDNPPYMWSNF